MAKCPICNDSGKRPGSDYLDCGCTASAERAELNTFAEDQISTSNPEERDWLIYTRAKALGRASALAELHPLWLAEKERADRAEARIAELEAQLAAASAPADTDKLREAILALPLPEAWITDYTTNDPAARLHFAADQMRDLLKSAADLAASTALQAPVREVPKYKLVPLEVTDVMLEAWKTELCVPIGSSPEAKARRAYRAMLAAAPASPQPVARVLKEIQELQAEIMRVTAANAILIQRIVNGCTTIEVGAMADNDKSPSDYKQGIAKGASDCLKFIQEQRKRAASTPTTLTEKKECQ